MEFQTFLILFLLAVFFFFLTSFIVNPFAAPQNYENQAATSTMEALMAQEFAEIETLRDTNEEGMIMDLIDSAKDEDMIKVLIQSARKGHDVNEYAKLFVHPYYTRGKMYFVADATYSPFHERHRPLFHIEKNKRYFIVLHHEKIPEFAERVLPKLDTKVIICIVDDPYASRDSSVSHDMVKPLLANPLVTVWLSDWRENYLPAGVNLLPIGMATMDSKACKCLHQISNSLPKNQYRPVKAMCTAHFMKYSRPASGGRNDRQDMYNALKDKMFVEFFRKKSSNVATWNKHKDFAFELCPEGNGFDTHRFYECIASGTIPIVRRNTLTPLYEKFGPVLVVDNWKDLNETMMREFHKENATKVIAGNETIEFDYWIRKIFSYDDSKISDAFLK